MADQDETDVPVLREEIEVELDPELPEDFDPDELDADEVDDAEVEEVELTEDELAEYEGADE